MPDIPGSASAHREELHARIAVIYNELSQILIELEGLPPDTERPALRLIRGGALVAAAVTVGAAVQLEEDLSS
jgi:hypothetical protein